LIPQRRTRYSLIGLFFTIIFIDQISKYLAPRFGADVLVNCGTSFGLGGGACAQSAWLFLCLTIFFALLLHKYLVRIQWTLITGAACSNLLDRFLFGGVRDWIHIPFIPLWFNAADIVIVGVVIEMIVASLIPTRNDGKISVASD
jgi:lipoprotein signal peptidase